MLKLNKAIR